MTGLRTSLGCRLGGSAARMPDRRCATCAATAQPPAALQVQRRGATSTGNGYAPARRVSCRAAGAEGALAIVGSLGIVAATLAAGLYTVEKQSKASPVAEYVPSAFRHPKLSVVPRPNACPAVHAAWSLVQPLACRSCAQESLLTKIVKLEAEVKGREKLLAAARGEVEAALEVRSRTRLCTMPPRSPHPRPTA
jgi:hypothetical protein